MISTPRLQYLISNTVIIIRLHLDANRGIVTLSLLSLPTSPNHPSPQSLSVCLYAAVWI